MMLLQQDSYEFQWLLDNHQEKGASWLLYTTDSSSATRPHSHILPSTLKVSGWCSEGAFVVGEAPNLRDRREPPPRTY